MSGALSAFGTVSTLIDDVAGLLILGPVVFFGLEVPETMTRAMDQALDQKIQPGGQVFLQAFGPRFPPIGWSGYLEGPQALIRSAQLEQLVVSAAPVPLIWLDRYLTVVVEHFAPRDKQLNWISYSISVRVLRDERTPLSDFVASLASTVSDDTAAAISYAGNLV